MLVVMSMAVGVVGVVSWVVDWDGGGGGGGGFGRCGVWVGGGGFEWSLRSGWERLVNHGLQTSSSLLLTFPLR